MVLSFDNYRRNRRSAAALGSKHTDLNFLHADYISDVFTPYGYMVRKYSKRDELSGAENEYHRMENNFSGSFGDGLSWADRNADLEKFENEQNLYDDCLFDNTNRYVDGKMVACNA